VPDFLDTDSDDDGCSDANEAYNDENADGGDALEFGIGVPNVNPDGTVDGASYVTPANSDESLGNTVADYTENGPDVDLDGIQDIATISANWRTLDCDGDTLSNGDEIDGPDGDPATPDGSDPRNPDTDGDGVPDNIEVITDTTMVCQMELKLM